MDDRELLRQFDTFKKSPAPPSEEDDMLLYQFDKMRRMAHGRPTEESPGVGEFLPEKFSKFKRRKETVTEVAGRLGYGMLSWLPSQLSGLGQIGFQKLNNILFGSEAKSLHRTPEERAKFAAAVRSPEEIRKMADQSQAIWDILPPPDTPEVKRVMEKIGKGFEYVFTPFRIADEYYNEIGYPNLGYTIRFIGELLFFKGVHKVGGKISVKVKKLSGKLREKASPKEVEKALDKVLDEMNVTREEIATPESMQRYIDEIYGGKATPPPGAAPPPPPPGVTPSPKRVAPSGEAAIPTKVTLPTNKQKIYAHKLAKTLNMDDIAYRNLAEKITGKRSMMEMSGEHAGKFIGTLRKMKEAKDAKKTGRETKKEIEEARIKREDEEQIRLRDAEKDRLEVKKKEAERNIEESGIVKETSTEIYHRTFAVPAVRDFLEVGNIGGARAVYNETLLYKSKLWGDKIKAEIDQLEKTGLISSKTSIEQSKAEFRDAMLREREAPGSITSSDIRILAGHIGDSRIIEALDLKNRGKRLDDLNRLAGIEPERPRKPSKPKELPEPPVDWKSEAEKFGVIYNGTQKGVGDKPLLALFTDPKTGSTFSVRPGEKVATKLGELREKFRIDESKEPPKKPLESKEPPKPREPKRIEVPYKELKSELDPVFDLIGESGLKRKKNFRITVRDLGPGEVAKVSPTWHDGTFRYTVLKTAEGELTEGVFGSYDTMTVSPAARGGEGRLPAGSTAYIIDLGPYDSRTVRIYRQSAKEIERRPDVSKLEDLRIREESPKPKDPEVREPTPSTVKQVISDDIVATQDMGIYAEIKEMIGKKKKVGQILKDLKEGIYYKEDLKDFGYIEKDIRDGIRAIKAEMGDKSAIRQIKNKLKEEKREVEEIPDVKPTDVERVHPETGRPAGVKDDLTTTPKRIDEVKERWLVEQSPITKADGSIVKSKFIAMRRAEELGLVGDIVNNPKGEGWLIKSTKEQRKARSEMEREEWEDILREEDRLGKTETGLRERERVDIDVDKIPWGERGAITFSKENVKKLKDLFKKGVYPREDIVEGLKKRGATEENIKEIFPDTFVQIPNKGVESKWLKPEQDPLEFLPRRNLKNGMKAPAVTRGEAHAVATMKDMSRRLTSEDFSLENPIRTFEKLPSEIKEMFYRIVKRGEKLTYDRLRDILKRTKKIRKSVPYTSQKRIGIHAIARQPDGIEVLAGQEITKIPKLKPKELKAYNDLRGIYDELYVLVNKARVESGEKPFPKMENYFTWMQDFQRLKNTKDFTMFDDWRTIESKMAQTKRVPSFRFAEFRAGPEKSRKLSLNSFEVIDAYAKTATEYIEMGPRLAKLHELLSERFGMASNAPHAYNFIKQWHAYQTGKIPAWDIANPQVRKGMQVLNTNIMYGLLSYYLRSAFIQPAALASSYAVLGGYYMGVGLSHAMSPSKWKRAGRISDVLNTRAPESVMYDAMEIGTGLPGQIQRKVGQTGLLPLTGLDSVAARITWLGAYAKALEKLKMSKIDAKHYADDIVTKTQASGARSDVAPLQRTQVGRTLTCLQTFVINHWGFITKDVMGIKNANINNPTRVKRIIRFVLATTAVNALFEDGFGLNSPNPTPIKAYREEFEKTENHPKAFRSGVKEIAEYIPIWGGRLRYGSELGGPVISKTLELIEKGSVSALTMLMGLPGANEFFRAARAYERRGTLADILLGRYIEPPKDKKGISSIPNIQKKISR